MTPITDSQRLILANFPLNRIMAARDIASSHGMYTGPTAMSLNSLVVKELMHAKIPKCGLKMYRLTKTGKALARKLRKAFTQ